jgi:hypothetical protein
MPKQRERCLYSYLCNILYLFLKQSPQKDINDFMQMCFMISLKESHTLYFTCRIHQC